MAQSIRVLYQGEQGTSRKNFNWDPIKLDSAVIITAAEFVPDFGEVGSGRIAPAHKTLGRPNLGEANVYVTNIGAHGPEGDTGGVEFLLHVDWGSPLDVVVTISVLEDIDRFFTG